MNNNNNGDNNDKKDRKNDNKKKNVNTYNTGTDHNRDNNDNDRVQMKKFAHHEGDLQSTDDVKNENKSEIKKYKDIENIEAGKFGDNKHQLHHSKDDNEHNGIGKAKVNAYSTDNTLDTNNHYDIHTTYSDAAQSLYHSAPNAAPAKQNHSHNFFANNPNNSHSYHSVNI